MWPLYLLKGVIMMNRKKVEYNELQIANISFRNVTWDEVRKVRNIQLSKTDWRFVSDQTPSQEWIEYRQFLRDLPQQFTEANEAADAWNEYEIPE